VTDEAIRAGIQVDRRLLLAGGILAGVGGVLGSAGILMLSGAIAAALKRWISHMEQPPTEIAKNKWRQARAATTAGAQAWQQTNPADRG
jgi:hypothetical protein